VGMEGIWVSCEFTADCVRRLEKGWEGKEVWNCVLRADCVRRT